MQQSFYRFELHYMFRLLKVHLQVFPVTHYKCEDDPLSVETCSVTQINKKLLRLWRNLYCYLYLRNRMQTIKIHHSEFFRKRNKV
jgi:hypothetical protein